MCALVMGRGGAGREIGIRGGEEESQRGGVEADREIERVIRERHTERVGSWQRSVREQ